MIKNTVNKNDSRKSISEENQQPKPSVKRDTKIDTKDETIFDSVKKGFANKYNTELFSSDIFQEQFKLLKADKSTDITKSTKVGLLLGNNFDGREVWKNLVNEPRDQGSCGGCYAFAVTSVMSARLSIYTLGKYKYSFSPTYMVICNLGGSDEYKIAEKNLNFGQPYDYNLPSNYEQIRIDERNQLNKFGCNGETLIGAWQYAYRFGLIEEKCSSYVNEYQNLYEYNNKTDKLKVCADLYTDTYDICPDTKDPMITHLAGGYYYVSGTKNDRPNIADGSERDIRNDIYKWGPCSSAMICYEDLITFNSPGKIYRWDGKSMSKGGHAISIYGWGEDADGSGKYWIIKNSWGNKWNGDGYFKIERGVNACEIEQNVFTGFPLLPGIRLYIEWPLLYRYEDFTLRNIWGIQSSGYKLTTIEKLTSGKLDYDSSLYNIQPIDSEIYLKEYWPDMSKLVSAEPKTIIFRLGSDRSIALTISSILYKNKEMFSFMIYTILLALIVLISYKIFSYYGKVSIKVEYFK